METLEEFARARKSWVCLVCSAPECQEIDEARAKGVSVAATIKWLQKRGYDWATKARLNRHFSECSE